MTTLAYKEASWPLDRMPREAEAPPLDKEAFVRFAAEVGVRLAMIAALLLLAA